MDYHHKINKVFSKWPFLNKKWPGPLLISSVIILGLLLGGLVWYFHNLSPVSKIDTVVTVDIKTGSSPDQIANLLYEKSVIRSVTAFRLNVRLNNRGGFLKAGRYNFSINKSTPEIIRQIADGQVSSIEITFYPGSTIVDNTNKPSNQKIDITSVFKRAGFSDEEIEQALNYNYASPLFVDKPALSDLEGYIFGETYQFHYGVTAQQILQATFDEFYNNLQQNNLIEKFKDKGLNLHQAITLASIIEKEAGSTDDHAQIAQVFYSRLSLGMNLGSDVTYQYVADKSNIARDINIDSPYNTRRYGGLPPGPIASPSLASLKAVAEPAIGSYLYFLNGDDGITYFANTEVGHNNNIRNHCQIKCSSL